MFAGQPLENRLPLHDKDLMVRVNVDDEPKTRYVDQITDQVRRDTAAATGQLPAGVVGIGGGSTMDLAKAVSLMPDEPGIFGRLPGMGFDPQPCRIPCGSAHIVGDRFGSFANHGPHRPGKKAGNQFGLHRFRSGGS